MQSQNPNTYVIQFAGDPAHTKPPAGSSYGMISSKKRSSFTMSKSPSPCGNMGPLRRVSIDDSTHFHRCESRKCLHKPQQFERRESNCSSAGSYKSEKKLLVNNAAETLKRRGERRLFSVSPSESQLGTTRITLKLLPEHRLAYKHYCNSAPHPHPHPHSQQYRSCSWSANSDEHMTPRLAHSTSKESLSPFTCIETISIKNDCPSNDGNTHRAPSRHRVTRSLRTTPVRTMSIKPMQVGL